MNHQTIPGRTANILGAFSLALTDRMDIATAKAAGGGAAIPAALVHIGTFPHETLESLRQTLGLSQSATTRVVDRLDENGYVNRGRGKDAREADLSLTPAGMKAMRAVLAKRQDVLDSALQALSTEENQNLCTIVEKLLAKMVKTNEESDHTCRLCDFGACPQDCCPAAINNP